MDSEEELKAMRKLEKKAKKEKKEKKQSKREIEVEAEPADASDAAETPAKKRKRETLPDELEIDVNLPEPASKKAARKAKKAKLNPAPAPESNDATAAAATTSTISKEDTAKRSEYGVWIGNLPWSATKDTLRQFLIDNAEMKPEQITRIHLPPPTKPVNPAWTTKPLNKGFAYVDFTTELGMYSAIALTETKMDGRALLIKNAKSFEGRPDKPKTSEDTGGGAVKAGGNPPNKRVFVGNLSFDVTKEDLSAHFSQCGAVEHIHMATFEDSGKCKGYAWITFGDVEAATSAVKGFIWKNESDFKSKKKAAADDEEEAGPTAEGKKRKWLLNKLAGRDLRAEFAEDSTTRYNKRYGKEKPEQQHDAVEGVNPARWKNFSKDGDDRGGRGGGGRGGRGGFGDRGGRGGGRGGRGGARGGRGGFEGKVDPRSIKSGAAHSNAQRASQAIVQAEGKKTTFE